MSENKHAKRSRITREKILLAAGKHFALEGYDRGCIRSISKKSGANLSTIMYHFKSKENLFLETIRYFILDKVKFDKFFDFFDELDVQDLQAVSDAIYLTTKFIVNVCFGFHKTEHMADLYTRILLSHNPKAWAMLIECFKIAQTRLPQLVTQARPNLSETDVMFWQQLYWSQLQYIVVSKNLITYDMGIPDYLPEYLYEASYRFALYSCQPIGLPAPNKDAPEAGIAFFSKTPAQ